MLVLTAVSVLGDDDFSSSLVGSGPYSFSKNSLGLEGFLCTSFVRGGGDFSCLLMSTGSSAVSAMTLLWHVSRVLSVRRLGGDWPR